MESLTTEGHSTADLVRRIRAGDRQAEEELFHRYRRGIATVLHQQGVTPDVTDDLLQETITISLQKIRDGEVREPGSLSAFICAVARNRVVTYYRKEARLSFTEDPAEGILSPPDQYERLLRKEEALMVRRVINELKTERDRQIILRYYLGEEEKEDICEDLALDSLHFNRVLHRALQRFKELFEKHSKQKNLRR